jgi:hypothetical protein
MARRSPMDRDLCMKPMSKNVANQALASAGSTGSADEIKPRPDEMEIVAEVKLPIGADVFIALSESLNRTFKPAKLYVRQDGEHVSFSNFPRRQNPLPNETELSHRWREQAWQVLGTVS